MPSLIQLTGPNREHYADLLAAANGLKLDAVERELAARFTREKELGISPRETIQRLAQDIRTGVWPGRQ